MLQALFLMLSLMPGDTPLIFPVTGRYEVAAQQPNRGEVIPSPVSTPNSTPAVIPVAKDSQHPSTDLAYSEPAGVVSERWLVSEQWCINCPAAKTAFIASGGKRENIITIQQAKDRHGMLVSGIPYEYTTEVKPKPPVVAAKSAAPRYNIYNGGRGSSHANRASLINHLLNEGVHKGQHSLAELNAMTDQELDDAHTDDHRDNGQVKVMRQSAPVYRSRGRFRLFRR